MHLQALQHQHLVGEGLLDEATQGEIDNLFVKEFCQYHCLRDLQHQVWPLNSLIAKSVLAGMKNSHSEGFLLAKQLKHTAHKHHHHDGAVCPSSGMVLMEEHTPPPGASFSINL
jgi:hypothetical protein